MTEQGELIPRHGGYRRLKSFQIAQLVYDVTVRFCNRYVERRSRTHDQMVQAARSGVQNIAEGSQASGTSKKTELKLTNVARASLEELCLDYEDYLRQRGLPLWDREDPRRKELIDRRLTSADGVAEWVREVRGKEQSGQKAQNGRHGLSGQQNGHDGQDGKSMQSTSSIQSMNFACSTKSTFPEIAANAAIVLIAVACSLLDRQLSAQAAAFENEGGFTERLYRTRSQARRRS